MVRHVELVGHHLPERRARALAAIRLADEERRRVVRMDDDPRVELEEIRVGIRTRADGLRQRAAAGHAADRDADDQRAQRRRKPRRETEGLAWYSASSIARGNYDVVLMPRSLPCPARARPV